MRKKLLVSHKAPGVLYIVCYCDKKALRISSRSDSGIFRNNMDLERIAIIFIYIYRLIQLYIQANIGKDTEETLFSC